MLFKRILSGVLGFLAVAGGIAILYGTVKSFVQPTPLWLNIAIDIAGLAIGSAVLILGFRYVRYACCATLTLSSLEKSYVVGVGCFFPGVVVSLPFSIYWARLTWPGDGQSVLAAMAVSVCIGVFATMGYWLIAFLKAARTGSSR
jgi:hypothetical protein